MKSLFITGGGLLIIAWFLREEYFNVNFWDTYYVTSYFIPAAVLAAVIICIAFAMLLKRRLKLRRR